MTSATHSPRDPEAIWFGPTTAPLAGFLHHPGGVTRGGAIICPPFGYEEVCAHRTLRHLGWRLAECGILTLRYDYEGQGSSGGESGSDDALSGWRKSVAAAIGEMRLLGVSRPALIGLRLGGALACDALAQDPLIGPLVLWAPTTSGRRMGRELKALSLITPGARAVGPSMNVLGHPVAEQTLADLRAWRPLQGISAGHPVLLVESSGWRDTESTRGDLSAAGIHPHLVDVMGTADVLERNAELVEVPTPLVAEIVTWVSAQAGAAPLEIAQVTRSRERWIATPDGPVREELVAIPPRSLHGVLCEPREEAHDCAVLFLNNGVAPARGPGRAWTEFARSLALSGVASLRLDLSGLGDSPDPPGPQVLVGRPLGPRSSGDMRTAVEWLRQHGYRRVVVVGLCSGALLSLLAATSGKLDADGVVAINAPLFAPHDVGDGPRVWRLWQAISWATHRRRVRAQLHRLPSQVWRLLDSLRLFPSPARLLVMASRHVDDVTVIFAAAGEEHVDLRVRAGGAVARLHEDGVVDLRVIEGMDHSLFDLAARQRILEIIREKCVSDTSGAVGV